jgi:hypothetical protein
MGSNVPFTSHAGVTIVDVGSGEATGALFTLGETASGAAMAGAIAPVLMGVRPVASNANIAYVRSARRTITATAQTSITPDAILEILNTDKNHV